MTANQWLYYALLGGLLLLAACATNTAPPPAPSIPQAPTTPTPEVYISPGAPTTPQGNAIRLEFAPGATSTTVEGSVERGARQSYILGARAGQQMQVSITALEENAVFTIYQPDGTAIAGTEEGQDATNWAGTLPATGDYIISVGGTRGNATYTFVVSITGP